MIAVGYRIIVKEEPTPEVSAGGVFLAPSARQEPNRGKVLSVGSRVREVSVGDVCWYTRYDGDVYKDENGEPVTILLEGEIIAVVERAVAHHPV